MIVTCDKCKTKYKVDDALAGKKIRCAKCGNIWRFELDSFSVNDFNEALNAVAQSMLSDEAINSNLPKNDDFPLAVNNEPKSQAEVDSMFDAPIPDEPKSQAEVDSMFDAPIPDEPKSQAEVDSMFDAPIPDEPKSQAEVDSMFDAPIPDEPKSQAEVDSMFDAPIPDEPKSQAEVDSMFDAPIPDATVPQSATVSDVDALSVFTHNSENENGAAQIIENISGNGDNFAYINPKDEKKKTISHIIRFFGITLLTMILFSCSSLWFLRFELAKEFPETIHYYELIGVDVLPVGTGLDFKDIVREKTTEENNEYLWIKGKIVNISEKQKKIPSIMLTLYDANHIILDSTIFEFNGKILEAGKDEPFTVWVENPSKNAAEAELTFTKEKRK